jgi:hypothetical protein
VTIVEKTDWLYSMANAFFEAPAAEPLAAE